MSIALLKEKLFEYLETQDINPSKKFKCIDPKHEEKTPSSHVYEGKIIKCFGCGKVSDIFEAAHLLEGLPSRQSPNFFRDNILTLARRFNVPMDSTFKETGLDIYNEVINYIQNKYATQRANQEQLEPLDLMTSWAPERFRDLQKKYIEEYKIPIFIEPPPLHALRQHLLDVGYSLPDLNQYGIVKYIFDLSSTKHLFPLWQRDDYCVGFMKRQTDDLDPKCLNVPNNPVFTKENYLYGLFLERHTEDLFIVEGQKDVLAVKAQDQDAVGISFATITPGQFSKLLDLDVRRYILALDNDTAGLNGVKKGIEMFIQKGIIPWVYVWSNKDADDDYCAGKYIDTNKLHNGITFYLDQLDLGSPETTKEIVRLLGSIDSNLSRLTIVNIFAETMQIDKKYLLDDIDEFIEAQKQNKDNKILSIYKTAFDKLTTDPSHHDKIILEAQQTINTLIKSKKSYDNEQVTILVENSFKDNAISKASEDFLFRPGGLEELGKALSENGIGWATTGAFLLSPGHSHTGKTLLLCQAIAEILIYNEDAMVFLFSTDDSLELLIPRIVAAIIGHPDYVIGYYYGKKDQIPGEMFDLKNKALNLLYRLIKENRFIAKDVSYCKTSGDFSGLVQYYKAKYPHRKPIIFNDNFHRNGDHREKEDIKRIELSASDIKNFAVEEGIAVWCSVEKRKPGNFNNDPGLTFSASNDDILGAGALVYYATHIIHTVNDYVQRGKDIDACVWVHEYKKQLYPQTQLRITKSKSNGNLQNFVFNMYPTSNVIKPVNYEHANSVAFQRARSLGYV